MNNWDWESPLLFVTFATCPFLKNSGYHCFAARSEMKGIYGITLSD
jgi:hypothetical protein